MFSAFKKFGKLGALASSVARAWSPLALWPDGVDSAGMWSSPSTLPASFNDYTGTTPVATPGTVADSANPVGLALDIRAGATSASDPGNHMLNATPTACPLESARVNLLTYTEDFGNAIWVVDAASGSTVTKTIGQTDPDGGTSAVRLVFDYAAGGFTNCSFRYSGGLATETVNRSWWIKSNTGLAYNLYIGDTPVTTTADTGWHRYDVNESAFSWGTRISSEEDADITVAFPQRNLGSTALPYQSVPGDGSTYTATGITPWQLYDGTDDGMATASFAAGTLSNGMDCLIAVRRDSGANAVCGLYESVAEANKVFGIAESGSSSGCVGSGAGTPTVWVDNTQLTGGTAVTRGTLHTALTTGDWHILEFRNLDLSTWTASGFGLYTSYKLPGARGDIMLYPSTASTTDKDKARQYLADKYGVTLP